MRKSLFIKIVFLFTTFQCVLSQTNTDTPNLSFEMGSFIGWKQYTGNYFYNTVSGVYEYSWLPPVTNAGERIKIINNNSSVPDPVIYCGGGLMTNPDNRLVARIGQPLRTEGYGVPVAYAKNAAAEKLEYSFVVTENTTLLSYQLAAVLHEPPSDNHKGEQRPAYNMDITMTDTNGMLYVLPCASYSSKADVGNTSLTRNGACSGSASNKPKEYVYQKWLSGNLDLSNHIGKTVTIVITNHDCLLDNASHTDYAGGHPAYGYFWAETKRIELSTFSCENADATIVAPTGFSSYTWTRSDGKPIGAVSAAQPHIAVIEQSQNLENVRYYCEMNDVNSSCGSIRVSTIIDHVKITPEFTNAAIDAGKIQFTDNSSALGDSITDYYWDFGDGAFSGLKNPVHEYYNFIPYSVKLTVTTSKGCSKTITHNVLPTKKLVADIFPPAMLQYNGQTKDFSSTTNIAGLQINIDYFIRYQNQVGTAYYNSFTAPSTVGHYVATFELSHINLLKYYMDVVPTKTFSIGKAPLTITVNNAKKVYGQTVTLLREAFVMSMNPLFVGDKVYELDMTCNALPSNAEVDNYPIIATAAIGMGVNNYEIEFVNGEFVVQPKPLTIAALDATKTYGQSIVPSNTAFYVAPNTLVGTDAIDAVSTSSVGFDAEAPVGNYSTDISNAVGSRLNNYTISYKRATLVVEKRNIVLSLQSINKMYGDTFTFGGNEYTNDPLDFVGNDSIAQLQLWSAGSATKANIGEYPVVLNHMVGHGLENYNIKVNGANMKVTPKPITITAKNIVKEYGSHITFDGSEFSTNLPLVLHDSISFITLKSNGASTTAPINNYDIVPTNAQGPGSLNYLFSYSNGTLRVIKKPITATLATPANLSYNNQSKTFTATVSDPSVQLYNEFVIRYSNADNSYNSIVAPSNAGNYVASFELTAIGTQNYEIINAPIVNFEITKAIVNIKANDVVKTYGDNLVLSNDAYQASMKPLFGSDMISAIDFKCNALQPNAVVGNYNIEIEKINGSGLTNYQFDVQNGRLQVLKKNLRIQSLDVSKVYGEQHLPTGNEFFVDPMALVNNDTVQTVSFVSAGFDAQTTVGNYNIESSYATGRGLSNYNLQYSKGTLYITRKNLTVTAANLSKTYGDEFHFVGNEIVMDNSQWIGTDSIRTAQLQSAATATNAMVGDHQVSVVSIQGHGLENYNIKLHNATFKVMPKNITITANPLTKLYGNLLTFAGSAFSTDQALVSGDSIYFVNFSSAGAIANAPVGSYSIFPSMAYGNATQNYTFSYVPAQLTVLPSPISATLVLPDGLVYNAQPKTCTATLSIATLKLNEHFFVRYTDTLNPSNTGYAAPVNAGYYSAEIELSYASSLNYSLTHNAKVEFEISKAPLTVRANDASKTYGQAIALRSDAFSTNISPLFGNDKIFTLTSKCSGLTDTCSVGTYSITPVAVAGDGLLNYDISYSPGLLSIEPKTIGIKALNASKIYGETFRPNSNAYLIETAALVGTDNILNINTLSMGYAQNARVGNYPITIVKVEGQRMDNYNFQFAEGNLQVLPKSLQIVADSLHKIYGNEYVFKGTEFSFDTNDLVNNDKVHSAKLNSIATQKTASVGEYALSITDVSGYGLENYNLKFSNSVFKVTPRNITVSANNIHKEFGDVYSFKGNEFRVDQALVNSDNISFVFLTSPGASEQAAIGSYPILPSMANGNGNLNYHITYLPALLTVGQKHLQVNINACEKEYGQPDPTFGFRVFDAHGIEHLPSIISGMPQRQMGEKPDQYIIHKGTLSSNTNYKLLFADGSLTIKKALPLLSASFSNDVNKSIIAYVTGAKNAKIPTGAANIALPDCGINLTTSINQGIANCMLGILPQQQATAHIHYPGDENYLPVSRSLKIYAIRYHCNGGELLHPISHFDGNQTISLETPTQQQRYRFEGWYSNPTFEGDALQRIVLGTYHDVDLYAKWTTTYIDLSVVVLFNQVLAVANPLNRDFLQRATYKWFKDGLPIEGSKQYVGFPHYVPTGQYKVEIYYDGNIPIVLEIKHTATVPQANIYPNPAKVHAPVTIESPHLKEHNTHIQLFDAQGKRQILHNVRTHENTSNFSAEQVPGMYFIRIVQNDKTIETHKLIIQK